MPSKYTFAGKKLESPNGLNGLLVILSSSQLTKRTGECKKKQMCQACRLEELE